MVLIIPNPPQNTLSPEYMQMLIMKDQVYNPSLIVLLTDASPRL